MAEVTITTAENNDTVALKVGDLIHLELPENATTGYRWSLDPIAPGRIAVESEEARIQGTQVGGGGLAIWTLRAQAPGRIPLRLKRWRHWEGERSVIERFTVTLDIQLP